MSSTRNPIRDSKTPMLIVLALIGGTGFILMTIALAVGVIQGENASISTIRMLFLTGLIFLVGGSLGWFGMSQPYKHIDDINVPHYTGHHDEDH